MRYAGLTPDFVVARSVNPLEQDVMDKLKLFSGVGPNKVINIPDLDSIYKVPLALNEAKIVELLSEVILKL